MIYVLFHWMKNQERDYMGFQTEKELIIFLAKTWGEIVVDKIIQALAELKFGLSVIDPKEMEFFDTAEEAKAAKPEEEKAPDYLPELKSVDEVLDRADNAIKKVKVEMAKSVHRTIDWKTCPICKARKVAPWSKHQECSFCRRPKGTRKYVMTNRKKSKID